MKKITNFLVEKRYIILVLVLIMAGASAILASKVHINRDISKYLPKTSEVRIGMDKMEEYFDTSTSSLNVMFKDLSSSKQTKIKKELETLKGIDEVSIKNKKGYTLYEITTSLDKDSHQASVLYDKITQKYENYNIVTSGDIYDENKAILPAWLVPLAIGCALVILIIMSESYIEPFLFLASILIAVLLNKGTNIFFPSISSITDSIAAILQLALSMDYSIMLINRYRQEKEEEPDNVKAMKKALYHAFKSISSSSVTTIVGLLALVFMSFSIGFDLGMVLAKGVLFSLFTIFTVLPSLILMFDKLINKTKKKSFNLKLDFLGKFIYKIRYLGLFLIIGIFIASFLLKGNLTIEYTDTEADEISKIFTPNNQMAIIYNNKYEDSITRLCQKLAENSNIDEVLCYGNTINEPLNYKDVNAKLKDLGNDTNVEEDLLRIVYYNYYMQQSAKMTFEEFVNFIKTDVYNNENMSDSIDAKTRADIDRLSNFVSKDKINQKRDASALASIFEISEDEVNDLLIYYNSLNNNTRMSLEQFVNFMNNYVLKSEYKDNVEAASQAKIKQISPYLNKEVLQTGLSYSQTAALFNMDEDMTKNLYLYYLLKNDMTDKMTLSAFAETLMTSEYYQTLDGASQQQLNTIKTFSDETFLSKQNTALESTTILNLPPEVVNSIYNAKYLSDGASMPLEEYTLSISQLVNFCLSNNEIIGVLDEESKANLNNLAFIINSAQNKQEYSYQEIAQALKLPEENVKNIYILNKSQNLTITPPEFVNFLLSSASDESLSNQISNESLTNLTSVSKIMDSTLSQKTYSVEEMAKFLNTDTDSLRLLYSLYNIKYQGEDVTLSYQEFVDFLLNNVLTNDKYAQSITSDKVSKIKTVNTIMTNALNKVEYNSNEILAILTTLSDNCEKDLIEMLYIYYGSEKEFNDNWQLSLEQLVNYLNTDILNDSRYSDFIKDSMKEDIKNAQKDIDEAKDMLVSSKYSRLVLNTHYEVENKKTMDFIANLKKDLKDDTYLIGTSPMAQDMSESFESELNLITILTIIFIFIVVCITFKSFLIPIILVMLIQTAVYTTMGILSFEGGTVYFIALLIVQSILMGATIDYAILYTSYYLESRKNENVKNSVINAYNKSIHTILTSASILIIVTLIVGHFSTAITSKICMTISQGTICSSLLILFILPMLIASLDRFIVKKK